MQHKQNYESSNKGTFSRSGCPVCTEKYLMRIRRRFIDRIFSPIFPVHRYRCHNYPCGWEGNIRVLNNVVTTTMKN